MLGTIINAITVIVGSLIGSILRRGIPDRLEDITLQAVGLLTLSIGIIMIGRLQSVISVALSLLGGSLIGELMNLEKSLEKFAEGLRRVSTEEGRFIEGMVTAFITFCVGPMTIIGSIEDGLGNPSILITKAVLDGFMALTYSSAMGLGVLFSVIPLIIYQGSLSLTASLIKPHLSIRVINDLTSCGGILLLGLGINLLGLRKIRVLNMLPSLFIVVIISGII